MSFIVRKARVTDVGTIYELLKKLASEGLLLPRSYANLYEMLQTLYVAEPEDSPGTICGTASLQVAWEDLAEVRSLAVHSEWRGFGVGRALTEAVERDARELLIKKMFALTYVPEFFIKLGYKEVSLESLPQKIWAVCFNCVYYPDCKEIAVEKVF
ncbi:MAG: N-acetyltransferase [Deltaproteobacteria bacterium]|jgi:amino-acid N-acetyltransferase|nr:N-acetyltransferase [Deltaproteobacteria bacterium]